MHFADDKWELQASISELKVFVHKIKESHNFFCFQMQRKLKAYCKTCPRVFCFCKNAVQQTSCYSFNSNSMEQVESLKGMVCLAKQFFNNCHFLWTEINKVQFYVAICRQEQCGFQESVLRSDFAYSHSVLWISFQTSLLTIDLKYWWILSSCWKVVTAFGFNKKTAILSLQELVRTNVWICICLSFFL